MIPLVEPAVLTALAIGSLAALVYWTVVLYHAVRTMLIVPTTRAGLALPLPPEPPRVCVIVPAHNEESCIAEIARTLSAQDYPNLACVFVLDRCTDRTRERLEEAWTGTVPVEILELDQCPPGWVGKSHAVWTGATASRSAADAALLLFVDADTSLHPGLVRSATALLRRRQVGMLSLMSTLTHDRWFEWLAQPAAVMELIRQYPIVRANASRRRRPFANGQFILIEASVYRRIDGHRAVREAVLEDVELARSCDRHGVPAALLLSAGMLRCRMYDSFAAFQRGWRRILGESANRKPARLRRHAARVCWTAAVLPLVAAAAAAMGLWRLDGPHAAAAQFAAVLGSAAVAVCLATWSLVYAAGRTPIWAAPCFPLGSLMTARIMRAAARDLESGTPTEWGGMVYIREGRA